jgi:AcrR family transcriptional regulator
MSRAKPANRLGRLVEQAARVFLATGYRQTQMSDIARALGVAPGTLYLYVESKEALFDLVMRYAMGAPLPSESELPVKQTSETALLTFFERTLEQNLRFPVLESAPGKQSPAQARTELEAIARELFRKTTRSWLALKLLEKSALDWPELSNLWFGKYRPQIFRSMAQYLSRRMQGGALRPVTDPVAAARLILEIIAAMGMHCRAEVPPGEYNEAAMEDLVADAVVHAYALPSRVEPRTGKSRKGSQ